MLEPRGIPSATVQKQTWPLTEPEALAAELRACGRAAFIDCRIHRGLSRSLPPIVFDHREAIDALMDTLNG